MRGRHRESGVTLIEVLVTIVIVALGLLGLAALQARIQTSELEAYQRMQALVLLQDMVDRIKSNRGQAVQYIANAGTASGLDCSSNPTSGYLKDLCDWNSTLLGASESITTGGVTTAVGAMIGARGCITNPVATMPYEFVFAVAWQGLTATSVPTASTCGQDQFGANDAFRRVLTARVVFSCLQSQADGVTCEATTL
ncbi:MAG: type IV pilus modification protein PilV [Betaproteobacteria bacterium]|nr:type IV pilus modification protein PilV [Betaproteobacteria bacterium]